jgi:hypothetical protein
MRLGMLPGSILVMSFCFLSAQVEEQYARDVARVRGAGAVAPEDDYNAFLRVGGWGILWGSWGVPGGSTGQSKRAGCWMKDPLSMSALLPSVLIVAVKYSARAACQCQQQQQQPAFDDDMGA